MLLKSIFPVIRLSAGMTTFSTREVIRLLNAPPMMTATAMSIMLPFNAKALNSSRIFFIGTPLTLLIKNSIGFAAENVKIEET